MSRRPVSQPTPLRIAAYIRVSSVGGRHGEDFHSPDLQRERIGAWAQYKGGQVVGEYVDLDESGRTMKRPAFERVMHDAKARKFDAIVVYNLSRFARDTDGALSALDELERHDVALVSTAEDIDTSTPGGKLLRTVMLAFHEFQSDSIGEMWREVHARRRDRGIAHVALGLYGYETRGAEIVGVNEDEAAGVRLIFELREQGVGYGVIRKTLHDSGFRPVRGGEFFAITTIKDMLRNPLYAGLLKLPDGDLADAAHPAIVPREQWDAVQATRQRVATLTRHRAGLLSGLVVCSGCGYAMKFERRGGRPAVYRCVARRASRPCLGGSTISADKLEDHVVRSLLLARATFESERQAASERQAETAARLGARVAAIDRTLDRLTGLLADEDDPLMVDEYERQVRQLVQERAAIRETLNGLGEGRPNVMQFPTKRRWASLDFDQRRVALRGLLRRIVVSQAETQGGRHDRGIDFDARVKFELAWDDAAWNPIVELIADGIDVDATRAEPDGTLIVMKDVAFADAYRQSVLATGASNVDELPTLPELLRQLEGDRDTSYQSPRSSRGL
jgi:site-specific DNA recombinase